MGLQARCLLVPTLSCQATLLLLETFQNNSCDLVTQGSSCSGSDVFFSLFCSDQWSDEFINVIYNLIFLVFSWFLGLGWGHLTRASINQSQLCWVEEVRAKEMQDTPTSLKYTWEYITLLGVCILKWTLLHTIFKTQRNIFQMAKFHFNSGGCGGLNNAPPRQRCTNPKPLPCMKNGNCRYA